MGVDMEQQPLLSKPATGIPAMPAAEPKVAPRQWRHKWYEIFGDGSPEDITSCCLAWKVPCVAWGWNQSRGLQLSFWRELLRFVLLTAGVAVGLHLACCLLMMTLCPEGRPDFGDDDGPHGPHRHLLHPHGEEHDHMMEGPDGGPGIHRECRHNNLLVYLAPLNALAFAAVYNSVVFFLAYRRTALRQRFGIDGHAGYDACLYFCCGPCALSQETRTLMHEQVHEGVWYGALPGVAPATAVPAAQMMAV